MNVQQFENVDRFVFILCIVNRTVCFQKQRESCKFSSDESVRDEYTPKGECDILQGDTDNWTGATRKRWYVYISFSIETSYNVNIHCRQ